MTPKERVMAALAGGRVDVPPVGAVVQSATLEQMEASGSHWPEAHRDPERMAALARAARTVLGFDLVRVPFDQTIEAELFGCDVDDGGRDRNCSVRSHPVGVGDPAPPVPDPRSGRGTVVVDAIRILKEDLGSEVAVLGGLVGPFTIAGYLLGPNALLTESLLHPERVLPYLEAATEFAIAYARSQVEAGADAISIEDMTASLDLISPDIYVRLAAPYERRLIESIPAPAILHICGNDTAIIRAMVETGADALSIDKKTDLGAAISASYGRCSIVGAVPPVEFLLDSTPDVIRRIAHEQLNMGVDLLAPACGIAPATPTENLKALVEAAEIFPRRLGPKPIAPGGTDYQAILTRYDLRSEETAASKRTPARRKDARGTGPLILLRQAVARGRVDDVRESARKVIEYVSPEKVLEEGLIAGMTEVSEEWDRGSVYLPHVILAADALEAGIAVCEQAMGHPAETKGRIVMFVARGDIHSIGKNIVKTLLRANGYETIDLGVDVPDSKVVQAVNKYRPVMLTGGALMTTTMTAFPRVADHLLQEGIEIPFACGGGAISQEFCETFPMGIHGGKAIRAPRIAEMARSGAPWREIRSTFHR